MLTTGSITPLRSPCDSLLHMMALQYETPILRIYISFQISNQTTDEMFCVIRHL